MKDVILFNLNGKSVRLLVDAERTLLWVLRTDLGVTSAKYGCGKGYCGACTILVDNEAVRSCQLAVKDVQGKDVLTAEGLSHNGQLHQLQRSFIENSAIQCGYCTPGMIMSAYGLLVKNPQPTKREIIDEMEGNLCRCGTYARIIEAIQAAAKVMKGAS